jgi:hypothetical protein
MKEFICIQCGFAFYAIRYFARCLECEISNNLWTHIPKEEKED